MAILSLHLHTEFFYYPDWEDFASGCIPAGRVAAVPTKNGPTKNCELSVHRFCNCLVEEEGGHTHKKWKITQQDQQGWACLWDLPGLGLSRWCCWSTGLALFLLFCVSFVRKSNNQRVTIYQEAGFPLVSAYWEGGVGQCFWGNLEGFFWVADDFLRGCFYHCLVNNRLVLVSWNQNWINWWQLW